MPPAPSSRSMRYRPASAADNRAASEVEPVKPAAPSWRSFGEPVTRQNCNFGACLSRVLCESRRHAHRGPIAKHFRHAGHDLRGVVADSDDRVGAERLRMPDHAGIGVGARAFAQLSEERDIAAPNGLKDSAERPEDRAGSYHDSAHDAKGAHDVVAVDIETGRRDEVG